MLYVVVLCRFTRVGGCSSLSTFVEPFRGLFLHLNISFMDVCCSFPLSKDFLVDSTVTLLGLTKLLLLQDCVAGPDGAVEGVHEGLIIVVVSTVVVPVVVSATLSTISSAADEVEELLLGEEGAGTFLHFSGVAGFLTKVGTTHVVLLFIDVRLGSWYADGTVAPPTASHLNLPSLGLLSEKSKFHFSASAVWIFWSSACTNLKFSSWSIGPKRFLLTAC